MKHCLYRVQSRLRLPRLRALPPTAIFTPAALSAPIPQEELSLLTESIRRHGLLQPIGVRKKGKHPSTYELLFGYRRLMACRALFLPRIPCLVLDGAAEPKLLTLCENLQRKDPQDASALAARLNLSEEQLVERMPLSPAAFPEQSPKPRDFSLFFEEGPHPEGPRKKGILRDCRLIANSIDRAVGAGREAGLSIEMQKIERAREICYHIRLPRGEQAEDFSHAG